MRRLQINTKKLVVLLGAGASKQAGVPTAIDMARAMIDRCASSEFQRPLRAIIGALQMQQADGRREVDIEQIMNASALLADRHLLEFAPFVGAWHPIIDEIERKSFSRAQAVSIARRAMRKVRGTTRSGFSADRAATERQVRDAIEVALSSFARHVDQRPDGTLFGQLSAHLTGLLINIATLKDASRLSYFDPLLELGRYRATTIATLNYDNTIELRAKSLGIECHTGIQEWAKSGVIPASRKGIQLLKLHGSVDWRWVSPTETPKPLFNDRTITDDTNSNSEYDEFFEIKDLGKQLAVLFGGRNKLTAEGPFLDLLVRFRSDLAPSTSLVTIGYSFRDLHINQLILRWLRQSRHKRLFIIDAPGTKRGEHPFFAAHQDAFGERVVLIAKGARRGISQLFR